MAAPPQDEMQALPVDIPDSPSGLVSEAAAQAEQQAVRDIIRDTRVSLARVQGRFAERGRVTDLAYPTEDEVGAKVGLPGASLLGYLVKDQLHPPMVPDEDIWGDGAKWYQGARRHTAEAAGLAELSPGQRVLDIGCGIGGPARQLVDEFGVRVVGITTSGMHAATAQEINTRSRAWSTAVDIAVQDCRDRFPEPPYDCVWSLNMLYHVDDVAAVVGHARDALLRGGRIMIDDWMVVNRFDVEALDELEKHFYSRHFAVPRKLEEVLEAGGFRVTKVVDLGHVGRGAMARHFEKQMWKVFAPRIVKDFPAPPHAAEPSGEKTVRDFCDAVNCTIRLYSEDRLTYRRLVAVRS